MLSYTTDITSHMGGISRGREDGGDSGDNHEAGAGGMGRGGKKTDRRPSPAVNQINSPSKGRNDDGGFPSATKSRGIKSIQV